MAEKPVYAHGELDAVKKRLGPISDAEARKMQALLGGEVGRERGEYEEIRKNRPPKPSGAGRKPSRIVETAETEKTSQKGAKNAGKKPSTEKASYADRVKMDVLCGDPEFGIKTWFMVFKSRFSFFRDPPDRVSAYFVRRILADYCNHLEFLVTQTRFLFPRNNLALTEKLKSVSPFSFKVLDVIRRWNIESISNEKARLHRKSNYVFISDFSTLIFDIYKPIYILECLEINPHIETVYNTLYRILFLEKASSETEKKRELISKTITAYQFVCKDMRQRFYPLFMKLTASKFYFYDDFFIECEDSIQAFLGVTENDRILPPKGMQTGDVYTAEDQQPPEEDTKGEDIEQQLLEESEEQTGNRLSEAEQKAFDKGVTILDSLFPKAGWLRIEHAPDLIPYFSDVKSLPKGSELIAPEDPTGIVLVLAGIIEELLYGFRKIEFTIPSDAEFQTEDGLDTSFSSVSILDDWQKLMEEAFERQFIPRVQECSQMSQHASQRNRSTPYAAKNRSALQWTRRYYFFPFYEYKDSTPPPFKKSEINAFYPFVRRFRKKLTTLAAAIDKAMKAGGREQKTPVEGIKNPWEPYVFQIENPLSKRLSMLLAKNQRDNVSLIFFTLAIVTVLDDIMNDEGSFAYTANMSKLYRTGEDNETPVVWIEKISDTMNLFKNSILERTKK
ncbi:MAG: hypothetical protein LBG74_02175 [Spirochaetaceae bacterium]|nr:hypothetical protein [Spirochaetaceae bacterium]